MSDRAILIMFLSMAIGWMFPDVLVKMLTSQEEVQIEIHYNLDEMPVPSDNIYDEEEKPRFA